MSREGQLTNDNDEKEDDEDDLGLAISFNGVQNAVSLQNAEELLLCDTTVKHFDMCDITASYINAIC